MHARNILENETCRLNSLEGGCRAIVRKISASAEECQRLYAMGLTPGVEIEALQCGAALNVVRVRNSSLILDRELGGKIECSAPRAALGGKRALRRALVWAGTAAAIACLLWLVY